MQHPLPFAALGVAALSSFLVGGLWYSPLLFGRIWQREAGDRREEGSGHPARVFGLSLLFAFVAALAYAWLVPPAESAAQAALQGLAAGAGLAGMALGINYQFADRSWRLWLIDAGYHSVQFLLYGLILWLWRA